MVRWKLLCHCERKGAADSALFSQPQSAVTEAKRGESGEQDRRAAPRHQRGRAGDVVLISNVIF